MEARFRADYVGEFVIINSTWSAGKKTQQREWIANPIENQHISGRAVCIGSRNASHKFNHKILQRHRGGLLGTLKLQTYGVGQIAEDMSLDFAVELDPTQLNTLVESNYHDNHVVYTTAKNCIAHPGDFYLIPLNPRLLLPALPIYLAAFDGHQEIFLLGYSNQCDFGNDRWIEDIKSVFTAYTGVKFWLVGESTNIPDTWLDCPNTVPMTYRDFIGYADI
jgi:hypothetical protein